jgi:hypothetical protein
MRISRSRSLRTSTREYQDPDELEATRREPARAWSSATLLPDDTLITTDVAGVLEWTRLVLPRRAVLGLCEHLSSHALTASNAHA